MKKLRSFVLTVAVVVFGTILSSQTSRADVLENWGYLGSGVSVHTDQSRIKIGKWATPWPAHIDLGKTGFLMIGKGGFGAYEVFDIDPEGECVFIFSEDSPPYAWKRLSFQVSKAERDRLLAAIEKANFRKLEKSYDDLSAVDGTQAFFSISNGATIRSVRLSNLFPDESRLIMTRVAEWMRSQHVRLDLAVRCDVRAGHEMYSKAFPKP